jgi:heptosyltransferase-1
MQSVPPEPRILLVRLSAIGDIVFASPLVAALRRAYPRAHVAWLVQPECRALLERHPALDEVIVWPFKHWKGLFGARRWMALAREVRAFRQRLREGRFDLAIDLQGLLKSGALTRLSGARERIGLGSREGSQWLMTRVIPRGGDPDRIGSEYLFLAARLGLPVNGFAMEIHYGPEDAAYAEAFASESLSGGPYAVICPFTTRPQKHWIEPRWADLAGELQTKLRLPAVMLGGPADAEAAQRIQQQARTPLLNLAGRTSLLQAAAIIDRADLLVGVDTGLSHMGIAYGRPSVLLFGSTCPYRNTTRANARVLNQALPCSPCRRNPTCHGDFTCMKAIHLDQVVATARDLVGRAA